MRKFTAVVMAVLVACLSLVPASALGVPLYFMSDYNWATLYPSLDNIFKSNEWQTMLNWSSDYPFFLAIYYPIGDYRYFSLFLSPDEDAYIDTDGGLFTVKNSCYTRWSWPSDDPDAVTVSRMGKLGDYEINGVDASNIAFGSISNAIYGFDGGTIPVVPPGSIEDPDDYGPAKVQWTSWGNKTTAPGEFTEIAYPASTIFNLYTGSNAYHIYILAVNRRNADGSKTTDLTQIALPNGFDGLPPNYTYQYKICLNQYVTLKKDEKYLISVIDLTTGEYVDSIGIIPQNDVLKVPLPAGVSGDKWSAVAGNAFSDTPLADGSQLIQPDPDKGIDGNPSNPSIVQGDSLVEKVKAFMTSLMELPGYLANAIGSLTSMGQQIGAFFGSVFSWMPSDMLAVYMLGIVLIVFLAVIKFIRG